MPDDRDNDRRPRAPAGAARPDSTAQPPAPNPSRSGGAADDASSSKTVKLPTITAPKGGGAIQSIGEKFAANPATGSAGLTVPIATSPGRAGASLGLDVAYDSGAGNGPFGVGWTLSLGRITRKTDKGIPHYVDENESDVFILSEAEDLVPVREGERIVERSQGEYRIRRYRPRVEGGFARIERWIHRTSGESHWRVTTRENITTVFGRSADARIANPDDESKVFSWLIEETRDDRGNIVRYEYKREDGESIDPERASESNRFERRGRERAFLASAQRYVKRIRYGNDRPDVADGWHFDVVFDYGEHTTLSPDETRPWAVRRDPFSSYRSGFELRMYRLCRRVLMFHRFEELGPDPVLVKSTDFAYEERDHLTLLRRVIHAGYLDGNRAEFPPLDLRYTLRELHDEMRTLAGRALEGISGGVEGDAARWVDLDGEGLPGALIAEGRGWYYKSNLGEGDLAPPRLLSTLPSPGDVRDGVQMLTDLASEGRLDLAAFGGTLPGYFGRTVDGGWTAFTPFKGLPNIDWSDPNLRFLDVDGDGLTDLLITQDDAIVWYRSRGKEGFGAPEVITKSRDEQRGAAVLFADGSETIFVGDMSGDGLRDIVRIRRGEVCYWPNLGYGRFGRKVTMDGSPRFTEENEFDPRRIRLVDVDGSGTTDVLYLGGDGVRVYFNESGNLLTDAGLLALPIPHEAATIDAVDLLGRGTTCLVWSSPLPADSRRPVAYVDLMGGIKPHLLSQLTNGIGAETRVAYTASTESYLRDKREGRPWVTRLAFPVQVVERVERYDHIAESKLVTRYRYHHGFYDGVEREFRGFAFVESWDAESFHGGAGKGLFPEEIERTADDLRVPPVLTKTWFHTGAWLDQEPLEHALAREYYRGDPAAPVLPPTRVPPNLRGGDAREAARALRGSMLRQEVYSEDGTAESVHPYTVSERAYEVRMLQPVLGGERHGVFFQRPREQLDFAYERKPLDPRVSHQLTLSVDEYGNVTESASIAYPRREPEEPEQARLWATHASARFVNHASVDGWYRLGIGIEQTTSELTGLPHECLLGIEAVKDAIGRAAEIPFEAEATPGRLERRVFRRQRNTYYRDDLSGPLPLGVVDSRALPYETYQEAFTPGLLDLALGDRVSGSLLEKEGGYGFADGLWWARSGRLVFDPHAFYQPTEAIDPFGNRSHLRLDSAAMLVVQTRDALGNVVEAKNGYRVLAPALVVDPNGNRTAAAYDARGMVVRIAVMGKEGEGDSLADPTMRVEYDPLRYVTSGGRQPAFVHTLAREIHGAANRHWQETYAYSDGSGRTAMQKVQADDRRWIGTGRTVVDNKGNPVKQYEPFFSTTPEFETERALVEWGVTPVLRRDPLGRVIRTDLPNGSFSRVRFDAWGGQSWDSNDTVLESRWYRDRGSPDAAGPEPHGDPARRAAWLAAQDADTPSRTHLDALGRTFLKEEDNRDPTGRYRTRTVLDVTGNTRAVIDARGVRTLDAQVFDLLSRMIVTRSPDGGVRRNVADTGGSPLRAWDARGFMLFGRYDPLRRVTHSFVRQADGRERLAARTVYGESVPDAARHNLRGQIHQTYDGAGASTNHAFDFKGNVLRSERRLARQHAEVLDWAVIAHQEGPEAIARAAAPVLEDEGYLTRASYDALNRVVSSITPDGTDARPRYNPRNLIDGIDVVVRGRGEPRPFARGIEYNARGQRVRVERGDGVTTTYAYDPETFRLARLETRRRDGKRLQALAYEYDAVGNIVSIHDDVSFGNASVPASGFYRYDALYRLISAEGREHPGQQPSFEDATVLPLAHDNDLGGLRRYREAYGYDRVGNILQMAHRSLGDGIRTGWTRAYEYAAESNRLLSTSAPADHETGRADRYSYDANGNMTAMPHLRELRWDYADRLSSVDRGGGGHVEFAYDSAGKRVRKIYLHSGLIEERIYLGSFEVYRKRRVDSEDLLLERETLHLSDGAGRVALLETKTIDAEDARESGETRVRYQLSNQIESSILEVDPDGRVITYEECLPFGASAVRAGRSSAEVASKRYRYTGKERDEETGLYYHGARYYAAWLGRWTSCDPAGFVDGPNVYAYALNSPIANADPTGTDANSCNSDPNNPLNYSTFEEFQANAVGPWSDEGLHTAWQEAHPAGDSSAGSPLATVVSGGIGATSSALRTAFTPIGPGGEALQGPFILWSKSEALAAARAQAAAGQGYTIFDTVQFGQATAEETLLRQVPGVPGALITDLPDELTLPIWVKYSRIATREAAISGVGVTTANLPGTIPGTSIQATTELPTLRFWGTGMGALSVGGGAFMLASIDTQRDPGVITGAKVTSGLASVAGGGMEIARSWLVGSTLVEGGTATTLITGGAALSGVGTVIAAPIIVYEVGRPRGIVAYDPTLAERAIREGRNPFCAQCHGPGGALDPNNDWNSGDPARRAAFVRRLQYVDLGQ